jgi:hypothetical protein
MGVRFLKQLRAAAFFFRFASSITPTAPAQRAGPETNLVLSKNFANSNFCADSKIVLIQYFVQIRNLLKFGNCSNSNFFFFRYFF